MRVRLHRDGTNSLKAELRTNQLKEEELRKQLGAKEAALGEAEVSTTDPTHDSRRLHSLTVGSQQSTEMSLH